MTHKTLVTLGPSSMSQDIVKQCADQGVCVFRINLSHTPLEEVAPTIDKIRSWTDIPICLDSEGAQMLNQNMETEAVTFTKDDQVRVYFDRVTGDANNISFIPEGIALSFANRPEDVEQMREACGPDANTICKIESRPGLANLDGILELADEILIDRGDLSRCIAIEENPFLQRRIISTALARRKPVFVATNQLESVVLRKSSTRAEVNDVVSTLLMGIEYVNRRDSERLEDDCRIGTL